MTALSPATIARLAHEANDCAVGFITEIADHLARGRPVAEVTRLYRFPAAVVRRIDEALNAQQPIYEAAQPERTTMPDTRPQAIAAAVRQYGTGPQAVAVIRRELGVDEAQATAAARLVNESIARARVGITETEPDPAAAKRDQAQRLVDRVNAAEAKEPTRWSHDDIEAMAASAWPF